MEIVLWIYLSLGFLLGFVAFEYSEGFINANYLNSNNILKRMLVKYRTKLILKILIFFLVTCFWILIMFYILDLEISEKQKLKN